MNGSVNNRTNRSIQNSKFKGNLLNGSSSDSKPVSSERRSSVPSGTSSHQKLEYDLAKDILEELKGRIGDKVETLQDGSPYKNASIELDTMVRVLFTSTDGSEKSLADKIGLDPKILQTGSLKDVLLEFGSKMYDFQVGLNDTLESGKSLKPLDNGELASLTNTQRESLNDAYWLLKSVRVVGKADSGASSANSSFQKDIQQFKEAHEEIALTQRTTIGEDGKVSYNQAKDSKSSGAAFTNYFAGALAKDLEFRQESAQKAMATMQDINGAVAKNYVDSIITQVTGKFGSSQDVKSETLEADSVTKSVVEAYVNDLVSSALESSRASDSPTRDSLSSSDLADKDSTGTVQNQSIDLEESQFERPVQTRGGDGEFVSRSSSKDKQDLWKLKPSYEDTVENKEADSLSVLNSDDMGGLDASLRSADRTDDLPVNPLPLQETSDDSTSMGPLVDDKGSLDQKSSSTNIPTPPFAKKKSTSLEEKSGGIQSYFEKLDQTESPQNKTKKKQVSHSRLQVPPLNFAGTMHSQSAPNTSRHELSGFSEKPSTTTKGQQRKAMSRLSKSKKEQKKSLVQNQRPASGTSQGAVSPRPLEWKPNASGHWRGGYADSKDTVSDKQGIVQSRVNYDASEAAEKGTPNYSQVKSKWKESTKATESGKRVKHTYSKERNFVAGSISTKKPGSSDSDDQSSVTSRSSENYDHIPSRLHDLTKASVSGRRDIHEPSKERNFVTGSVSSKKKGASGSSNQPSYPTKTPFRRPA